MLLAGTELVIRQISPGLVGRQTDEADVAAALIRRIEKTFVLQVTSEKDALEIAAYRIGQHRRNLQEKPYIPYEEEAIKMIWKKTLGNLGDFVRLLEGTYELARDEGVSKISTAQAERVIRQYWPSEASPNANSGS